MNDFISTVRTDRKREMMKFKEDGIAVSDWHNYRYVDELEVVISDKDRMKFGFQADQDDVYFFIIDDGANSYYSIKEIYHLLHHICNIGNASVITELLEKIMSTHMKKIYDPAAPSDESKCTWENRGDFIYRGITYHMKRLEYPQYNGNILMLDGGRSISYMQLFVLVNLIQEKSNAFFTRGEGKQDFYIDGLARLFSCLLMKEGGNDSLSKLGWLWNEGNKEYELHDELVKKGGRKYYLTEEEYLSIMSIES